MVPSWSNFRFLIINTLGNERLQNLNALVFLGDEVELLGEVIPEVVGFGHDAFFLCAFQGPVFQSGTEQTAEFAAAPETTNDGEDDE